MSIKLKFRGKDVNGDWYYGNLTVMESSDYPIPNGMYIANSAGMPFAFQVRPETVGQFIGLSDREGKELYTHDLVYSKLSKSVGKVVFMAGRFCLLFPSGNEMTFMKENRSKLTKVGNIFDDPELWKKGEQKTPGEIRLI